MATIGVFHHPGKYMKDFFFFRDGDGYRLIYNVGEAGPEQSWMVEGNEDSFGHASSTDLENWEIHEPVMFAERNSWEGMVISAPCIRKINGVWHMLYTGFSDQYTGVQAIGLATSQDLFSWQRHPGNPVYTGPDYAEISETEWSDCRDPHFIEYDGHYVMYTSVRTKNNEGAIDIVRSDDLVHWASLGHALTEPKLNDQGKGRVPESPCVFERKGKWYCFTSQNEGFMTDDPEKPDWTPFPFCWDAPGMNFLAATEVVQEGDRYIIAMFDWKMKGNAIYFWEIQWRDDIPYIDY